MTLKRATASVLAAILFGTAVSLHPLASAQVCVRHLGQQTVSIVEGHHVSTHRKPCSGHDDHFLAILPEPTVVGRRRSEQDD